MTSIPVIQKFGVFLHEASQSDKSQAQRKTGKRVWYVVVDVVKSCKSV